jgi:hypothetical protein
MRPQASGSLVDDVSYCGHAWFERRVLVRSGCVNSECARCDAVEVYCEIVRRITHSVVWFGQTGRHLGSGEPGL